MVPLPCTWLIKSLQILHGRENYPQGFSKLDDNNETCTWRLLLDVSHSFYKNTLYEMKHRIALKYWLTNESWPRNEMLQSGNNNAHTHTHDGAPHHWQILLMEEILHQLIGSLSHYLPSSIHPRWCRISSINFVTQTNTFPPSHFSQWHVPVGCKAPHLRTPKRPCLPGTPERVPRASNGDRRSPMAWFAAGHEQDKVKFCAKWTNWQLQLQWLIVDFNRKYMKIYEHNMFSPNLTIETKKPRGAPHVFVSVPSAR